MGTYPERLGLAAPARPPGLPACTEEPHWPAGLHIFVANFILNLFYFGGGVLLKSLQAGKSDPCPCLIASNSRLSPCAALMAETGRAACASPPPVGLPFPQAGGAWTGRSGPRLACLWSVAVPLRGGVCETDQSLLPIRGGAERREGYRGCVPPLRYVGARGELRLVWQRAREQVSR